MLIGQVLLYNGQLDLIVGVPLTERYLPTIQWFVMMHLPFASPNLNISSTPPPFLFCSSLSILMPAMVPATASLHLQERRKGV